MSFKQKTESLLASTATAGLEQKEFQTNSGIKLVGVQVNYVECCLCASVFADECVSLTCDTITEAAHGYATGLKGTLSVQTGCAVTTPSACISAACNLITEACHGLTTGEKGRFTTTCTLPSFCCCVISACTDYYVISLSTCTYTVATTRALAIAGTSVCITGAGVGCQTFTPNGAIHTGLSTCACASFIIKVDDCTYKVASSRANALACTAINITALNSPASVTFTPSTGDATSGTVQIYGTIDGTNYACAGLLPCAVVINACTPANTISVLTDVAYSKVRVDVDITDGQFTVDLDAIGKAF